MSWYLEKSLDAMLYKYTDYEDAYLKEVNELVVVTTASTYANPYTGNNQKYGSVTLAAMGTTILAELIVGYSTPDHSTYTAKTTDIDFGATAGDRIVVGKADAGASTYTSVIDVMDQDLRPNVAAVLNSTRWFTKGIIRDNGTDPDGIQITLYMSDNVASTETTLYVHKFQLINPA